MSAGPDLDVCINDNIIDLANEADKLGGTWSGRGVNASRAEFRPADAGLGSHILTYRYDDGFSCSAIDTKVITVYDIPVVDAGSDLNLCLTENPIDLSLSAFPVTGVWTGPGVSGGMFDPGFVGAGTFNVTYTVTSPNGCQRSDVRVIRVTNPPTIDAGDNMVMCVGALNVDLDLNVSVTGGTWSGPGVSGSFFNPSVAGIGTHLLTYSINDGFGCVSQDTRNIQVRDGISINAGPDLIFCRGDANRDLTNDPSRLGGTWSGPGVTNRIFRPNDAGAGSHTITYSFTDEFGCTATDTRIFNVLELPAVTAGADVQVCANEAAFRIDTDVFPAGGVLTGNGVVSGEFVPAIAGPGTHNVTYSYIDGNGCTNTDMKVITVNQLPVVDAGSNFDLCINAEPVTLNAPTSGGTWEGSGIINGVIDPLSAGIGVVTATYTVTNDNGCETSDSITITIVDEPDLILGDPMELCSDDNPVNLLNDVNLKGGTFTGPGMSGTFFNPANASVGSNIVTYTYRYFGCEIQEFRQITVYAPTELEFGEDLELCTESVPYNLMGDVNVLNGVLTGSGVSDGFFYPDQVTVGSHVITYSVTNAFGCLSEITKVINVVNEVPIDAGSDQSVCNSVAALDLRNLGVPSGGVYISPHVENGVFNATGLNAGNYVVEYFFDNGNGCVSSDNLMVTIFDSPIQDFGRDSVVCLESTAIPLNFSAELSSGRWSGPGVIENEFFASLAGIGNHTLTYSNDGFDCDVVGTRSMTVVDLPDPPSSTLKNVTGCVGRFVELTAEVSEENRSQNVRIYWYREGETEEFQIGESISYQVRSNERIYYEAVSDFGCSSGARGFINITINNPTAVINSDKQLIEFGGVVQFFAEQANNAVDFEWDFGDGTVSYEKNPFHYYYDSGSFDISLTITSVSGCETQITAEDWLKVESEPGRENSGEVITGIEDYIDGNGNIKQQVVSYGPNPVNGLLKIEIVSGENGEFEVIAVNQMGTMIQLDPVQVRAGLNKLELDVKELIPGVHVIQLVGKESVFSIKVIKL